MIFYLTINILIIINIIKMCKKDGCKIRGYFNFEGETKELYCFSHKKENMVNIKDKKCDKDGCKLIACYNKIGEKKGIFCAKHKE